ncbi:MAG: uncharacterized protein QOG62_1149 [Thermoleophilaceae bacterium]|nr:uncharacterized protein [Thermoleophilaceae bacterium]
MTLVQALAVAAAGLIAGASNSIAGGGSLITFPTLVALGVPPLAANVTNTLGLIPGAVGGAVAYAGHLEGQRARVVRLLVPTLLGAVAGTALLLTTPEDTFEVLVPPLVAGACLLLLFQKRLSQALPHAGDEHSASLYVGVAFCGAYAAYFGSAVSILLLAVLVLFVPDDIQRLNGVKLVLAGCANLLAAIVYVFLAPIVWSFAAVLLVSSLIGGRIGGHLAQRVPGDALRIGIGCAGLAVSIVLAVRFY